MDRYSAADSEEFVGDLLAPVSRNSFSSFNEYTSLIATPGADGWVTLDTNRRVDDRTHGYDASFVAGGNRVAYKLQTQGTRFRVDQIAPSAVSDDPAALEEAEEALKEIESQFNAIQEEFRREHLGFIRDLLAKGDKKDAIEAYCLAFNCSLPDAKVAVEAMKQST